MGPKASQVQSTTIRSELYVYDNVTQHDEPNDTLCSPLSAAKDRNGDYIMFPQSGDGSFINNHRWSPCSIKSLAEVIQAVKQNRPYCLTGL